MEEKRSRITCANHPDVDAVEKCVSCGKFFCRECIDEIETARYQCRKCRDLLANLSETIGFAEKYNLRSFRLAFGGCLALIVAAIIAMGLLVLIPYLRLRPAINCRGQLKQVYRAFYAYANDNAGVFPPANNDLVPLYGPTYSQGVDLLQMLKCPGTENVVSIPAHLKDDSTATIGTGMSYLYQGGLKISTDENKLVPLLWDQTPGNHRGTGINVLYTNGKVKFIASDYPELKGRN